LFKFFFISLRKAEEQIIGFDILIGAQLADLLASFVYTVLIKFGMFSVHQQMINKLYLLKNPKIANLRNLFRFNHSSNKGNRK
jgi:hypothetical protein